MGHGHFTGGGLWRQLSLVSRVTDGRTSQLVWVLFLVLLEAFDVKYLSFRADCPRYQELVPFVLTQVCPGREGDKEREGK